MTLTDCEVDTPYCRAKYSASCRRVKMMLWDVSVQWRSEMDELPQLLEPAADESNSEIADGLLIQHLARPNVNFAAQRPFECPFSGFVNLA